MKRRIAFCFGLLAVFGGLSAGAEEAIRTAAATEPAGRTFVLRHGVVIDRAQDKAYVGETDGAVSAISLTTGRSAWRSTDAALPIGARGALLVAQGEEKGPGPRLRLVIFEVQTGRKMVDAIAPLPAGVVALVTDQPGRSFRAHAEADAGGFLVTWNYCEIQMRGIGPEPGQSSAARTFAGTLHINVGSGAITTIDPGSEPSEGNPGRGSAVQTAPAPPWDAGAVVASVEGARGQALVLKRKAASDNASLPDVTLLRRAVTALASADGNYLLGSERVGTGGPQDPEYRWSIFSLETGERVGAMRRDVSATVFYVIPEILVSISQPYGVLVGSGWINEPLKLHGDRLSDGLSVWDHAIRDVEFRGSPAP